ncbi:MAG: hypothetical protein ABUT39_24000 [Acidobacteriota bacterium]
MSLIDEALRRARQEAARQDAARRDDRYRQVPVLPPSAARRPSRSGRPMLIAVAVALCIVAGIGIGVLLGRNRGEETTVAAEATATPVESAPPLETPRPQIVVEETPEPALETPIPETPAPTPTPAPEPPPRQELPAAEAEPVDPPPALDATPAPMPAPEPAAPAPAPEIRTYVREVPLPDGGSLRLNGIAFSSDRPVALIDDRVLGVGESYRGFLVADIQAGQVELQGNGMTVRVSLK